MHMTDTLLRKADLVAEIAHAAVGQKRKYTNEPYIVHPREVMFLLKDALSQESKVYSPLDVEAVLAAALLHDTVEDTELTGDDIQHHFGLKVREFVMQVTDVSKSSDGNRKVRKEKDLNHLARASPLGKSLKLCDLISNTRSIVTHDKTFAKTYLQEKTDLLNRALHGSATPLLYKTATTLVEQANKMLEGK